MKLLWGVWGACLWLYLCRRVVALFPGWRNCIGPHATPSSDVWLLEVAGTAKTTPLATVSIHQLNHVRVASPT